VEKLRAHAMTPSLAFFLVAAPVAILFHISALAYPWSWQAAGGGSDFASYYHALQLALDGGNPYWADILRTKGVHPFLYPPPFLLAVSWAGPLSLSAATTGMFLLNELLLVGCLIVLRRGFGAAPWILLAIYAAYTPLIDNQLNVQANLLALLPALAGLAVAERRPYLGGALVGVAAMLKMSPAILLLIWVIQGRWRPIAAAAGTAVALSILALPVVGPREQLSFYQSVLPAFGEGQFYGLSVPISTPLNHSIAEVLNRFWPGPSPTQLAPGVSEVTQLLLLAALGLWGWRARRASAGDLLPLGALFVIMTIAPTYTFEHHLSFLLLPLVLVAIARPGVAFALVFVALAWSIQSWPEEWYTLSMRDPSALSWWARLALECKLIGALGLLVMCLAGPRHRRAVTTRSSGTSSEPVPTAAIAPTASIPSVTWPNAA
jgi:alpha-1,2-mannosyltransferase